METVRYVLDEFIAAEAKAVDWNAAQRVQELRRLIAFSEAAKTLEPFRVGEPIQIRLPKRFATP